MVLFWIECVSQPKENVTEEQPQILKRFMNKYIGKGLNMRFENGKACEKMTQMLISQMMDLCKGLNERDERIEKRCWIIDRIFEDLCEDRWKCIQDECWYKT